MNILKDLMMLLLTVGVMLEVLSSGEVEVYSGDIVVYSQVLTVLKKNYTRF